MPLNPLQDQLLETPPAQVSTAQAAEIAATYFARQGQLQKLTGERDLNFQITDSQGHSCLLKLSHPLEDPQVVDFQNAALLQVAAADPQLPVQRLYTASNGAHVVHLEVAGQPMLARLLSFAEGLPLHRVTQRSRALRENLGQALARLGLALQGLEHSAAHHELLWDLKHAARLRRLLPYIEDAELRRLAEGTLDTFEQEVLPRQASLRAQVIHNDLNPHNVIVDTQHPEELRGILDFGDMVHAPLINDLGVAAAYQVGFSEAPLDSAVEMIAAYHRHSPLEEVEQLLLGDLIAMRLAMTLCITAWRANLHPENRDYIVRNTQHAAQSLQQLAALSRQQIQEQILAACPKEPRP